MFFTTDTHKYVTQQGMDVPAMRPSIPLAIGEVGINAKKVWIRLPEGRILFDTEITVGLPAEARGIHMSRIEQAISDYSDKSFANALDYARDLARKVVGRQQVTKGKIHLSGFLPMEAQTLVSAHKSTDCIAVEVDVTIDDKDISSQLGVGVHHITACPCTQVYNETAFGKASYDHPLPSHSQRSFTQIMVDAGDDVLDWQDLFEVLDQGLHITHDLLKRSDEAELVLQAHARPQFAEDAVREIAAQAAILLGSRLTTDRNITITSHSYESIHIHDVVCRLKTSMGDILAALQTTQQGK